MWLAGCNVIIAQGLDIFTNSYPVTSAKPKTQREQTQDKHKKKKNASSRPSNHTASCHAAQISTCWPAILPWFSHRLHQSRARLHVETDLINHHRAAVHKISRDLVGDRVTVSSELAGADSLSGKYWQTAGIRAIHDGQRHEVIGIWVCALGVAARFLLQL